MRKPKAIPPVSAAPAGIPAAVAEWAGLLVILALFIWLMSIYFVPAFFGAVDESAYLLEAKQLATTHQPIFHAPGPLAFTSENMLELSPEKYVAKYPPGFPLLCAAGYLIAGNSGALLVNPILAVAAVIGMFLLLRHFVSPMLALAGTITLALHPMTILYATGSLSHMTETACCIGCFVLALRWSKNGGLLSAALAALLLAYAGATRYTAALAILPFLVLAIPRFRKLAHEKKSQKLLGELAALLTGFALGIAPLLIYQTAAFGSPFATGYGTTQESSAFSFHWFTQHAWYALKTLSLPGYGLVLLFPLALASLFLTAKKQPQRALFLAAWIIPPLLLYMSYYWFPLEINKANYVRFYYQLFPPIILGALLLIQHFTAKREWLDITAAVALGLIALASFAFGSAQRDLNHTLSHFAAHAADLVNRNVPAHSPVLCDMDLAYFAVFATNADIYTSDYFDAGFIKTIAGDMHQGGTQIINPLRAQRINALLADRSQPQLDDILIQFLSENAPRGVYLLTAVEKIPLWKHRFAGKLDLLLIDQSPYEPALLKIQIPPDATTHP